MGHVGNDLFLKLWVEGKNSFKDDPPNAALSIFHAGGRQDQAVVVLTDPRIEKDDLIYTARVLEGTVPQEAAQSTLFIDGSSEPCQDKDRLAYNDPSYSGYPCWADDVFSSAEN